MIMSRTPHRPEARRGVVYLVGAGPGDASLLTVRAARLIAAADVVFHDALISDDVLALVPAAVTRVAVGRRKGRVVCEQEETLAALVDWARRGAVVVRLKGGDPLVFGRAGEELDWLRAAGVEVEIVPGVTAASAAAATLAVSLTRRGAAASLAFVSGHSESKTDAPGVRLRELARIARSVETLAVYMGATRAASIARALLRAGRSARDGVAVVERASLAEERVHRMTLGDLARRADGDAFAQPAILLIGPTLSEHGAPRAGARRTTHLRSPARRARTHTRTGGI